jgi:hypothetical protein
MNANLLFDLYYYFIILTYYFYGTVVQILMRNIRFRTFPVTYIGVDMMFFSNILVKGRALVIIA